jgi:hypothetical protein
LIHRLRASRLQEPMTAEIASDNRFIQQHGLGEFCLVIFNSNEFVFID